MFVLKYNTNDADESWFTSIVRWSVIFAVVILPIIAMTVHQVMSSNLDDLVDNAI